MREKRNSSSAARTGLADQGSSSSSSPSSYFRLRRSQKLRLLQVVEILADFAGCKPSPDCGDERRSLCGPVGLQCPPPGTAARD